MSYETYKLGKIQKYAGRKRYTYEELVQMDLPRLREICKAENIKPPTMDTLEKKGELVALIYRYIGTVRTLNIKRYDDDSVLKLETRIGKEDKCENPVDIELPAQLKIYKGFHSLKEKGIRYEVKSEEYLLGTYAFLLDHEKRIQAILEVEQTEKKDIYCLSLKKDMMSKGIPVGNFQNMSLLFFTKDFIEDVIHIYNGTNVRKAVIPYLKVRIPEVFITEVSETEEVLVIDYGTSYTTAGTYQNGGKKYSRIAFGNRSNCELCFLDGKTDISCEQCELCPSVVSVKSCSGNQIEFTFGHEAIKEEKERGYLSRNSIFYDTKRWVNHYKEKIRVSDLEGNTCEITGSLIVGAFLLYIIKTAEQQNKVRYKNIYFTCPVKQKLLSLKMYQDVLKNYNVITKDLTDEAVAVVYHSLADKIEEMDYKSGETKKVLILDCGGGTSDLVRCDYTIFNRFITSEIEMNIRYAHGDTNFGGNNLTYRILQYLKIRLAEYYGLLEKKTMDELFSGVLEDVYEYVDENGVEQAYDGFLVQYHRAEERIPTSFFQYQNAPEHIYLKVKGNYYFLWYLAESLKKSLYNQNGLAMVSLSAFFSKGENSFTCEENFHLFVKNKTGILETYTSCPNLSIVKEEINLLLKPEVYSLIKNFMEPYYEEGMLEEIHQIYLSGQTSKIELFREVLKEFLAGRKAKSKGENSCVKKFMCIDGAIAYQGAKKIGRIRSKIKYSSPVIPYHLTVPDFHSANGETYLIEEGTVMEEVYGFQSRAIETEEITFTLKDRGGSKLNQYVYPMGFREYKETSYERLLHEYPILKQEDLDNISSGEVKLFIFCENESWGFFVLEVARKEEGLYEKEPNYIPFENTQWEKNFFDGLH